MRLIINYHYWLVRPASFPAASARQGWHGEARPGVLLAPWGRSRGRAAAFGESAFLRAASDIGGPLRGLYPSPFDPRDSRTVVLVPLLPAGRKEKKRWLPESASGRQKDRVLCARVCICVRSFRCPYVGLVMRERMRSPRSGQGGGHSMKRFIDYRPGPRHCFIARAVVLLARRRLEMSIMPAM